MQVVEDTKPLPSSVKQQSPAVHQLCFLEALQVAGHGAQTEGVKAE